MNNIFFTEKHYRLKEELKNFLIKELEPFKNDINNQKKVPLALIRKMGNEGYFGPLTPEKYGGTGGSFLDICILLEVMGAACCPGPFFSTVVLGGAAILLAGTDRQKQAFLPKIASGKLILALATTEPGSWYGVSNINMSAARQKDEYVLNGTKLFVENGQIADFIICLARADASKSDSKGLTLFLVDTQSSGVKCSPFNTLGYDKQSEVIFDNVKIPKDSVLGNAGRAGDILERLQELAAVAKCAELVGCIQTAFDTTVAYAKERKQFGRPIGCFQAVQHHCADMVVDVDGSRFITYQAAWKIAEGLPSSMEAAMAKAWTSAASRRVTSLAHQIHGAISFTEEVDVHLYYRRAKAGEVAFGDADYHLEKVARQIDL